MQQLGFITAEAQQQGLQRWDMSDGARQAEGSEGHAQEREVCLRQ